jgi:lactoylglutathione lyase
MFSSIATVAVYVDDQDRALWFWTKQVGFELRAEHPIGPDARWLEVAPRGAQSAIVLYPKAMMPDWQSRKPSIVFATEDIEATCAQLAANGVVFAKPLVQMQWSKFASFLDTDGNEFGIRG